MIFEKENHFIKFNINIELLEQEIDKNNKKVNKNNKNKNKNIESSILQELNFFSQNSIKIQNKIKEIPFYATKFHCFSNYSLVDFNEINKDTNTIEKHDLNKKYIIIKYLKKNIQSLSFDSYFFSENLNLPKNKNIYIKKLLETYHDLIKSLLQLNNKSICYFSLNSTENIFFNEKKELIIENFEKSIDYSKKPKPFFLDIIKIINESLTCENIHYFPPEIFIIHYLIKKDVFSLSFSIISEISGEMEKVYINSKNNNSNSNNSNNIYSKVNIYQDVSSLLSPLVNKTKEEVIDRLSKFIYTWDNYCLSLLYIKMINIIKIMNYDTNYTFLSKWIILLKKNIYFNPLKRENMENTLEEYNSLLD